MRRVAEEAGVSVATVSNALNGTGRLSEETRQRVLAAIERLSYLPYATLRAGARGGTGVLGLTMTSYGAAADYTTIPYYSQLILGTISAANRRGYLLVVLPSHLPAWSLMATPMDGVIQCEPRREDPVGRILAQRGIARVLAGRPPRPDAEDVWVDTDDGAATRDLLDHLTAGGSERIGLLLPDHDDAFPDVVRSAYDEWCSAAGHEPIVEVFAPLPDYERAERAAAKRLLRRGCDAAFGIYTASGHHLLAEARAAGLVVPDDLKVACFSDDPAYAWTDPPVTTVAMAPAEVGAAAVDLLVAQLDRRRGYRRHRLLRATMTVRGSTR